MKYLFQLMIICAVSFLGELLKYILPFPIPGSVYGLGLMLLCLIAGVIKMHQVEDTANYLLVILPILFISPSVNIMNTFSKLQGHLVSLLICAFVSTLVTMSVTGLMAQAIIRAKKKNRGRADE